MNYVDDYWELCHRGMRYLEAEEGHTLLNLTGSRFISVESECEVILGWGEAPSSVRLNFFPKEISAH